MDSVVAVDTLMNVDPQFEHLVHTLLGDVVDPAEAWAYLYGTEQVVKMSPDGADVHVPTGEGRGRKKRGRFVAVGGPVETFKKADQSSVTWEVEFSKVDSDKREVFGWASVVELDGRPVVDRQGDLITPDEIERAAYSYVMKSRTGGHQHRRDGAAPFKASDMIESIVFTDEKVAKMGLPDDFPRGWWVGYKVHDEDTWSKVKNREVTGFSIHGSGKRQKIAEVS